MAMAISTRIIPLSEDDAIDQARLLKALSDPTRLRIVSLLSRYEGDVCVAEIREHFTFDQATISYHLRILVESRLIECHKTGLYAYYHLRREQFTYAAAVVVALVSRGEAHG